MHAYRSRVTGTGCLSRYPNELALKFFKARLKIFLPQRHTSVTKELREFQTLLPRHCARSGSVSALLLINKSLLSMQLTIYPFFFPPRLLRFSFGLHFARITRNKLSTLLRMFVHQCTIFFQFQSEKYKLVSRVPLITDTCETLAKVNTRMLLMGVHN